MAEISPSLKKTRSTFYKAICFVYLFFPISYAFVIALLFDIPPRQVPGVVFSPLFLIVSVVAMTTAYGLLEIRRWSWYFFMAVNGVILYENILILFKHGETHHPLIALQFLTLSIFLIVFRISRELRVPYIFPKIRWWESTSSADISMKILLMNKNNQKQKGELMDLSVTGCFVKTPAEAAQDEVLTISINAFGHPLVLKGMVVLRSHSTVTMPKGLGIRFLAVNKQKKRALRMAIQRLKQVTLLKKKMEHTPEEEEFLRHLDRLESQPESHS